MPRVEEPSHDCGWRIDHAHLGGISHPNESMNDIPTKSERGEEAQGCDQLRPGEIMAKILTQKMPGPGYVTEDCINPIY